MGPDLGKYCSTSPFHGTNWEVTKPDLTKKLCTRIIVLCYYCLYSHPTHFTVYKGGIPYLRGLLRPGAEPAVARPSQTPGPGHYVAKVLITVDFEDKMSWMSGETISLCRAKVNDLRVASSGKDLQPHPCHSVSLVLESCWKSFFRQNFQFCLPVFHLSTDYHPKIPYDRELWKPSVCRQNSHPLDASGHCPE